MQKRRTNQKTLESYYSSSRLIKRKQKNCKKRVLEVVRPIKFK